MKTPRKPKLGHIEIFLSPHLKERLGAIRKGRIPDNPDLILTMEQAASIAVLRGISAIEADKIAR